MSDPAGAHGARRGGPQRIPRPPGAVPGPIPPWGPDGGPPVVTAAHVRRAVGGRRPGAAADLEGPEVETLPIELPGRSARPAAVLCAIFDDPPTAGAPGQVQAHVLLTRRSDRLRSHTGEVSFPGGRLDDGEDHRSAALREAYEEVGLAPHEVEIVGQLSPLATLSSRAAITPFVGVLAARPELHLNRDEVERAIMVPVAELWAPGVYHEELWPMDGGTHAVHFFDLVGDTVWGATARMLRELLDLLWAAMTA